MNLSIVLWSFLIYSFVGWVYEMVYYYFREKKIIDRGFLYGPFCTIYGISALLIVLVSSYQHNLFLFFIIVTFLISILEYFSALILEVVFKTRFWNYSGCKFNLHGRISLFSSLFWGFLGIFLIKFIHPFFLPFITSLSQNLSFIGVSLIVIYFLTDYTASFISLSGLKNVLQKFEIIKDQIQIKDLIKSLKKNQLRIIKSFPSITSNKFTLLAELKKYF